MQNAASDCNGDGDVEEADDFYSLYDMTGGRIPAVAPVFDALWLALSTGFDSADLALLTGNDAADVVGCELRYQVGTDGWEEACEAYVTIDGPASMLYLQGPYFLAYSESNGCAGLQRAASDCDGDGEEDPADTRLGP